MDTYVALLSQSQGERPLIVFWKQRMFRNVKTMFQEKQLFYKKLEMCWREFPLKVLDSGLIAGFLFSLFVLTFLFTIDLSTWSLWYPMCYSSDAARVYSKAADLFNTTGRFGQSAKMLRVGTWMIYWMKECDWVMKGTSLLLVSASSAYQFSTSRLLAQGIAEAFDAEGDTFQAMQYYKRASDFFEMDEFGKSSYTACILKYAEYTAKLEKNYKESIRVGAGLSSSSLDQINDWFSTLSSSAEYSAQIFEQEGEKALRGSVVQFGAKDHFLKAGILRLVVGVRGGSHLFHFQRWDWFLNVCGRTL